jgi:hypothetical protein
VTAEALDEIEIPTDMSASRLAPRKRAARSTSEVDPDDVGTVDDKVTSLYAAYPQAAYETTYEWWQDGLGVRSYAFVARVWLDRSDVTGRPDAVAHAERTQGVGEEPYASRAMETAESVALGRALRFIGIDSRHQRAEASG